MQLDDKICYCFHVSKRKVMNFLRVRQPRVPSQLSECQSAGTGCGWCVPFLKRYFAEWQAGQPAGPDDVITPDEYARQRGAYIRAGKGTPPPGATPPPEDD